MGYMRHHTIVVSSWSQEHAEAAHASARTIFADTPAAVSEITAVGVNGYRSFFVAPDGSKEGWDTSDAGDVARASFVEWLDAQRYDGASSALDWVEVQFGDDEGDTCIVRDSDEDIRAE